MTVYKVFLCTGTIFPPGIFNKDANISREKKEEYKNLKKAINAGLNILTHPITFNHKIRSSWIEIFECKISKFDESKKEKLILIIAPDSAVMFGENKFVPQFIWYKDYIYGNIELKQQLETKSSSTTPVMDLFRELSGITAENDQK